MVYRPVEVIGERRAGAGRQRAGLDDEPEMESMAALVVCRPAVVEWSGGRWWATRW